jgi:hypothetical protein
MFIFFTPLKRDNEKMVQKKRQIERDYVKETAEL